jgi:serine/threonine-protein kinase RsbW
VAQQVALQGMSDGDRAGRGGPAVPASPTAGAIVLLSESFTADTVTRLRHAVIASIGSVGLSGPRAEDFVLAVHELVTNAVCHGGGSGRLELRLLADVLTCDIIDHGRDADGLPIRLSPTDQPGGRGLWLAHQLAGSLMLSRRPDGVTASVTVCLTEAPAAAAPLPEPGHSGTELTVTANEDP